MGFKKIKTVEELKHECDSSYDFFIHFGGIKSSKGVTYHQEDDTFSIHHEIDDTWEEEVSPKELEESNIGKAIKGGSFYAY
jgi:hypothetical protein